MLGLIKKDLLMTKSNFKTILIIFVVYMLVAANGNGNFSFIPAFISIIVMMSTFSYDEYNKTNAFISTMPNGRQNAIKSKYITTLIILAISVIFSVLLSVITQLANNSLDAEEIASTLIGSAVAVILIQSVLYPFIFKFGVEKSRIGMFVGALIFSGGISLLMKSGISIEVSNDFVQFLDHYWMIIIPLMTVIILFISYSISKYLYMKKEF